MTKPLYMRSLLLLLAIMATAQAWAQTKLGFDGEDAASVGIYVKEISTGKVIASANPSQALLPASIMKSITAASALEMLGTDFTFKTPIILTGRRSTVDSTVWLGNLVIESCGDPTIDSENFSKRPSLTSEIITALKKLGIKKITGRIQIIETLTDAGCVPQWEIDDVAWAYGAGLYGFNYRDNKFSLWPATGETKPYVPDLTVSVFQDKDGTDLVRGIYSNHLIVMGPEPTNPKWRVQSAMQDPAGVFATQLEDELITEGIELLSEDVTDDEKYVLYTHQSPPCYDILCEMMSESHNLYAEGMLRAIANGKSRDEAIKAELAFLRGLGVAVKYNKICDGSGLARADRIQPQFIGSVLDRMAKSKNGKIYASLFPKVGVDGTVKKLLEKTRLKGTLALKSGSMNGVQCFAGYKLDSNGEPTHVVVIMVNSFFCQRAEVRASIEAFLLKTF